MESLGLTVSVANGGTKNNDYSATNSPRRADIVICPNRFVCKDLVSQMLVEVVLLVTCFSFQSGYGQSCYVPGAYHHHHHHHDSGDASLAISLKPRPKSFVLPRVAGLLAGPYPQKIQSKGCGEWNVFVVEVK